MRRFAFVFFLIMLFFTTTHPAFGNIVAFSNPINLSNSPSLLTFGTDITASGNNVYAVWVDSTVGGGDIFFRRSIDGGATFSSTINLSNDVGSSLFPHVVASGNSVYVIWSNGSEGSEEIFFRRSIDGGATFSSTINLSNIAGSSTSSSLAVSGNVYAVWEDNTGLTGSNSDIFYKRSTDGGANFENPVKNLSNSPTNSSVDPLIIASGTNVYVLWNDGVTADADDIFFARSTDSGANFSSPANLSNTSSQDSFGHFIMASGTNVYVAWQEKISVTNSDIFFAKSTDGGANFENPVKNLSNNSQSSEFVRMTESGSNLYVIWQEKDLSLPNSKYEIFLKKSVDGGTSFVSQVNLSNTAGEDSVGPEIFSPSNNLYVLWEEGNSPNKDILFKTSTDNGVTYSDPINLSNSPELSIFCNPLCNFQHTAVSDNNVYASWHERTGSGKDDVFFSTSMSCSPPTSGNWDITSSCILQTNFVALEDVTVHSGAVLTIPSGNTLDINFALHHLLVQSGGGVLIKAGGKIF